MYDEIARNRKYLCRTTLEKTYSYTFYKALESSYLEECKRLVEQSGWPYHIKASADSDEIVFKMIKGFSLPPVYEYALFVPEEFLSKFDQLFAERKYFFSDNDEVRKVFLEHSLTLKDMVTIIQTNDLSFDGRDKYLMKEILHENQTDWQIDEKLSFAPVNFHSISKKNKLIYFFRIVLLVIISLVAIFKFLL